MHVANERFDTYSYVNTFNSCIRLNDNGSDAQVWFKLGLCSLKLCCQPINCEESQFDAIENIYKPVLELKKSFRC